MQIHIDYDLTSHNTFGIAAKAAIFLVIEDPADIPQAIALHGKPTHILWGGSNLVITKDIDGVVWHITYNQIAEKGSSTPHTDNKNILLNVWAGMIRDDLVRYTLQHWWRGIENLIAIPWCVGAAPVQNIGAYWVEFQDVCDSVDCYDTQSMTYVTLTKDWCNFAYRYSIFKEQPGRYIIYAVTLRLSLEAKPVLTYTPVIHALEQQGFWDTIWNYTKDLSWKSSDSNLSSRDNLQETIATTIENIRWSKLPKPTELGNSGSFFQNPIVNKDIVEKLLCDYPTMPHYAYTNEQNNNTQDTTLIKEKLSAARLIDNSNLKWYRIWQVWTYPLQPLVLVQYWWATGQDIIDFSDHIIHTVQEKFGITLQREVNIW